MSISQHSNNELSVGRKGIKHVLLFAHTGITLGCALITTKLVKKTLGQPSSLPENTLACNPLSHQKERGTDCAATKTSKLHDVFTNIDYRFILLGSLLPDIIDKPVGGFFFRYFFSSGRIFSHTLLFLVILIIASAFLYRSRGKTWLAAISFGTLFHLILDSMWREPKTLFWPLFGFSFERVYLGNLLQLWLDSLLSNPAVYIPELVGATILVAVTAWLLTKHQFHSIVKKGSI